MDFAPGGTNFPHHHETAEEIYLVIDGEGEMVAGGGTDGIEGRHPAKAGDALLPVELHGGFLQPEQTRRKGSHSGGAIADSTGPRRRLDIQVNQIRGPVKTRCWMGGTRKLRKVL